MNSADKQHKAIDRAVRKIDVERLTRAEAATLQSVADLLGLLLQLYEAVGPLLDALAAFAVINPYWRKTLLTFRQTFEALRAVWEEDDPAPADFKAGKDL